MRKSHKKMKTSIICIVFVALFSGMTARAAENLEGKWAFTMRMGDMGMEIRSEAVFTKAADGAISGTWEMRFEMPEDMQQPGGDFQIPQFKLTDINLDEQKLTFTQTMEGGPMGNMQSNFSGTINGDKIEGTMSSQFGETPITGVRIKDIVGDWIFKVNLTTMGGEEITVNSTISKDANGTYAMTWEQEDSGQAGMMQAEIKNENIKLDDDKLTFLHIVSMGDMGEFQMNFSGTFEGDKISGTLASDMGNITVTAERKAVDVLSGEWAFTMTFGDMGMEIKSKAIFTKSDDGYTATWESIPQEGMPAAAAGEAPSVTLENIKLEGDKLSFVQKFSMGDMGEFQSDFSGTLEGDKITGELTSQMGTAPLNAVRVK